MQIQWVLSGLFILEISTHSIKWINRLNMMTHNDGSMIIKEVKQYKNSRPRIEINKGDNLEPGTKVVIVPLLQYQEQTKEMEDLKKEVELLKGQIKIYENQEVNMKKIVEDVTTPIHSQYKNELEKKDNKLNEVTGKFEALQHECVNYNLELNGFNGLELVVFRKHKKLAKKFSGTVELIVKQKQKVFTTTTTTAISGESQDNKTSKQ